MIVNINKTHLSGSHESFNCPVARALKDRYGFRNVDVGCKEIVIGKKTYRMSDKLINAVYEYDVVTKVFKTGRYAIYKV